MKDILKILSSVWSAISKIRNHILRLIIQICIVGIAVMGVGIAGFYYVKDKFPEAKKFLNIPDQIETIQQVSVQAARDAKEAKEKSEEVHTTMKQLNNQLKIQAFAIEHSNELNKETLKELLHMNEKIVQDTIVSIHTDKLEPLQAIAPRIDTIKKKLLNYQ